MIFPRIFYDPDSAYPQLKISAALAMVAIFVTSIIAVTFAVCYVADKHSCYQTGSAAGRPVRYGLYTGCLIQTGTGYIPLSNYQSFKPSK